MLEISYPKTIAHEFIMLGVIPDDDEGYVKMKYRFQWGDGLVIANRRAAEMVHR
jgi:hypothetical protein